MGGAVQEDGARPLAEDVADVEASSSGSPSCNGRAVLQQPCSSNSNAHAHHHGHGSGRHGQDDTSGEDITTNGCPAATTTERVSSDKDTTTHVDGFSEQHPEEQHQLFLQQQSRPSSCVQPPTSSSGADAATATATGRGKAKLPRPETNEPCPRCSSEDTKFCYYNNYNIKQPRFFCKACQRYWTSGGTLRNVPPGSGRRKSKAAKDHDRSANSEHVVRQTNFPMSAPAPASNPASVSAAAAAAAYAANPLSALQQGPYSGSLNPLLADPMFAYNAAAAQQAQHQLLGGVAGLKLPAGMPVSANPWGPGDMNGCMYGPGLMGLDGNAAPSTSQQQQQQQRQAGDQGQEADEFGDTVESRRVRAKTETAGAAADAAQQGGQTLPGGCGGQADGHMSPSASPADGKHAAGAALSDQLNRQAHAMQTAWLQQAAAMQGAWQPGMAMMPGQAGGTAGGLPLDMQMLGGQQAMASALAASNAQQFQQLHAQGSAGAAAAVAAGVSPYQFNPYLFPSAAPGASAPGAQAWPYGGLGGAANMAGLLGGSNGQNPAMAAALVTQQLLQTRGGQASNASLNNFTGGGAAPGSWPLGAGAGASLPWGDGSMGLPHMGLPGMGMSMGMGMGMGMGMDPAAMGWACGMGPVMGSSGVLNGIEPTSCGAALANAGNAAGEGSGSPTAALGKHPRSADAAFTAT